MNVYVYASHLNWCNIFCFSCFWISLGLVRKKKQTKLLFSFDFKIQIIPCKFHSTHIIKLGVFHCGFDKFSKSLVNIPFIEYSLHPFQFPSIQSFENDENQLLLLKFKPIHMCEKKCLMYPRTFKLLKIIFKKKKKNSICVLTNKLWHGDGRL